MLISIVIPCYNEEARLPGTLDTILSFFETQQGLEPEIIVVSDGSHDGTVRAAEAFAKRHTCVRVLAYEPNRGKGYAVRRGMLHAKGELCLLTDADLATPISELPRFIAFQNGQRRVCIASRAWPSSRIGGWRPVMREYGGILFNRLVQFVAVPRCWDTQCGFKLFPRESIRPIFGRCVCDGFAYDVEALAIARRLGFELLELGVPWDNSPATTVRVGRDMFPAFRDVMLIALRRHRGYYDDPLGDV